MMCGSYLSKIWIANEVLQEQRECGIFLLEEGGSEVEAGAREGAQTEEANKGPKQEQGEGRIMLFVCSDGFLTNVQIEI